MAGLAGFSCGRLTSNFYLFIMSNSCSFRLQVLEKVMSADSKMGCVVAYLIGYQVLSRAFNYIVVARKGACSLLTISRVIGN